MRDAASLSLFASLCRQSMTHSKRLSKRNERQQQLNQQFSTLPAFTPINAYEVHHIHRATPTRLLHDLITLARETKTFTIDTEHDYRSRQPALIQVEFVRSSSIVLLIETCHLPNKSSTSFWLIRSLLKMICQPSNLLLAWGSVVDELSAFASYGLVDSHMLNQLNTLDVQRHFKQWYNRTFVHGCGLEPFEQDSALCTCAHRPVKDRHHSWSLQKAIAYAFDQFLDKSRTKSQWSRCLDPTVARHAFVSHRLEDEIREQMIRYAVHDCLAVTKLMAIFDCFSSSSSSSERIH